MRILIVEDEIKTASYPDFIGRDVLQDNGETPRAFISTYQKLGYLTEDRLLVLGPRRYAAQYRADRHSGTLRAQSIDKQLLGDMLAYYQGSDYIYQHRLNRIH